MKNYFLIALDSNNEWFRFHHLFQQLLVKERTKYFDQIKIKEIQKAAIKWFVNNNYIDDAIKHCLLSDNIEYAVDLVYANRSIIMNNTNWFKLEKLLEHFSLTQIENSAILYLTRAWILIYKGKTVDVFKILDDLISLVNKIKLEGELKNNLKGEIKIILSRKNYYISNFDESINDVCDGFALLDKNNNYPHGIGWIFYFGSMQALGKANMAIKQIYENLDESNPDQINLSMLLILCYIYYMEADMPNLEKAAINYSKMGEKLENKEAVVNANYFLGASHYHTGELEEAEKYLIEAHKNHFTTIGIHFFNITSSLVLTLIQLNKSNSVTPLLNQFSEYAIINGNPSMMEISKALEAEVNLRCGNLRKAEAWALSEKEMTYYPMSHFFSAHVAEAKILTFSEKPKVFELATDKISSLLKYSRKTNNRIFLITLLTIKAIQQYKNNIKSNAFNAISEALSLAEIGNVRQVFINFGKPMYQLLTEFSRQSESISFLGEILKQLRLDLNINLDLANQRNELLRTDDHLTKRENEILFLLADKLRNKEIAEKLFISPSTVKRHTINIYQKLNVSSREEVVKKAKELGILN